MYTLLCWFRWDRNHHGERYVYIRDAQQVHVIGLNQLFRSWYPQRWSVLQLVTLVLSFHVYVTGWLIITIRGEKCVHKDAQQVHVIGLNHLFRSWYPQRWSVLQPVTLVLSFLLVFGYMCTLWADLLYVIWLECIWQDEDVDILFPKWTTLKKVESTVCSTFSSAC